MSFLSDKIRSSQKISEYLSDRGIHPLRESADKKAYLCPLPKHTRDKHPSFFIYDKGDHEDYTCFGCKSAGSIINFVAEFEQIPLQESTRLLGANININDDEVINHIVKELISGAHNDEVDDEDVLHTAMFLSRISHDHLSRCNFDKNELEVCEKMFRHIDLLMMQRDEKDLDRVLALLPSHLTKRYSAYQSRQKQKEIDSLRSWKI